MSTPSPIPHTPRSPSCDVCRARKVRCSAAAQTPPLSPDAPRPPCEQCVRHGITCTWEYRLVRRPRLAGIREGQRVNRVEDGSRASGSGGGSGLGSTSGLRGSGMGGGGGGGEGGGGSGEGSGSRVTGKLMTAVSWSGRTEVKEEGYMETPRTSSSISPLLNDHNLPRPSPRSLSSTYNHPTHPSHSHTTEPLFANTIPHSLLIHAFNVYFDYLYPTLPCIHRPTALPRIGQYGGQNDEWTAVQLLVAAATLVQVPWAFVSANAGGGGMGKEQVRDVAVRCMRAGKGIILDDYAEPSLMRCTALFFAMVVSHNMGQHGIAGFMHGAMCVAALSLGLHQASSYVGLDPVESEMRKRVYWLIYQSDRSRHVLMGTPTLLIAGQCVDVDYPAAIDDAYIASGKQPHGIPSAIEGTILVSQLFNLIGKLLDWRRQDQSTTPRGAALQQRMNEVNVIHRAICDVKWRDQPAYQTPPGSWSEWQDKASDDISQFLNDPLARHGSLKDPFLAQRANVFLTQQIGRCLAITYQCELATLQEAQLLSDLHMPLSTTPNSTHKIATQRAIDTVADDLSDFLARLPLEAIAIHSAAAITKIRYVAATQLEGALKPENSSDVSQAASLDIPLASKAMGSPASGERRRTSQERLWGFINFLSELEALTI